MIFDYDDTLAPVLTPLGPEMCKELCWRLREGVNIAIVSTQPIRERGLAPHALEPLKRELSARGESLALLRNLYLLPSDGACVYRPDHLGQVDPHAPLLNLGFTPAQFSSLRERVLDNEVRKRASAIFERGSYISVHFPGSRDLEWAKGRWTDALSDFTPPVEVVRKVTVDPRKRVLHVRLKGITKATGRDWLLRHISPSSEALEQPLSRRAVLVAGDRMGVSPGMDADSQMLVLGAVNLAVGDEAHPLARANYRGLRDKGVLAFLQENRQMLKAKAARRAQETVSAALGVLANSIP
jgi:hypothetical protein